MLAQPESQEEQNRRILERQQSLAATGKFIWPIPDKGLKKRIHRIKTPTLLIWGEDDKLAPPDYAEDFRRGIPQAQLVTVPNGSHLVLVEQADRVADAIVTFAREE
jgi:pimeloyl-ACP methyl ester carboxylesterase